MSFRTWPTLNGESCSTGARCVTTASEKSSNVAILRFPKSADALALSPSAPPRLQPRSGRFPSAPPRLQPRSGQSQINRESNQPRSSELQSTEQIDRAQPNPRRAPSSSAESAFLREVGRPVAGTESPHPLTALLRSPVLGPRIRGPRTRTRKDVIMVSPAPA